MDFTALENSLLVKQMVTEKDWAEYDSVAYRIGKVYIDKFVGVLHRCERACMSEKQMKEIQNYLEEFQAQIEDFKPK